jgi:hypothetical protein
MPHTARSPVWESYAIGRLSNKYLHKAELGKEIAGVQRASSLILG